VIGGLIFGVGFGLLGYCPGTIAGAVGNGYLDALTGGLLGIIFGSALFAFLYPELKDKNILTEDKFSKVSYFDKVNGSPFKITIPFSLILIMVLFLLDK
jgi:ABC-type antimicrobial peptide transport system permease subunit